MSLDVKRSLHKQPPPPNLRKALLQFVCTVTILLAFVAMLRSNRNPRLGYLRAANLRPKDSCHVIGTNPDAPDLWQFSTRSLCMMSRICFNASSPTTALFHSSNMSATTCHVDTHDFRPTTRRLPALVAGQYETCDQFQHNKVLCAHGSGLKDDQLVCPIVVPWWPTLEAGWVEDISVVVPDFPYTYNIYHYASLVADVVRTVENLEGLLKRWGVRNVHTEVGARYFREDVKLGKVNLVLQSDPAITKRHRWKWDLFEMSIKQRLVKGLGLSVNVTFLQDMGSGMVCLRNAVVLGRRGHVNLWPFANDTNVPLHGLAISKDATDFKRSIFDGSGIRVKLPSVQSDASDLPPFTVAYARRKFKPGEDGYYRSGSIRRFADSDEEWFEDLLKNETSRAGAKLMTVEFTAAESLRSQVATVAQAGFIVGIHGANLANAIFMKPFGVLMEILPQYLTARCYIAGANSGLKYLRFVASATASPEESGCDPDDDECKAEIRQRMIKFGEGDRERVREMVREGIEHLRKVRERFPRGVRTKFNSDTAFFDVES